MAVAQLGATLLLSSLTLAVADTAVNLTLLSLPVNLTSWQRSLRDVLNHSLWSWRPLEGPREKLCRYLDFIKNGSIGCSGEGEECIPDVPSCCPSFNESVADLQCVARGTGHVCSRPSSSEESDEAGERLEELEHGDSAGRLPEHPWTDTWGYQSRSAMEREELRAAEETQFRKNWQEQVREDNFWKKTYNKIKKSGHDMWQDMRKMKKLKEVKEILINKYKDRMKARSTVAPVGIEKQAGPEDRAEEVDYPEDLSGKKTREPQESEESIIKFSDEVPKKEKKIDFKLDDVIKDAVDLVNNKLKEKKRQRIIERQQGKIPIKSSPSSIEEPFHIDEITDTEDKLKKEINELKKLKDMQKEVEVEHEHNEPSIDELIRKQVAAILDEERKLDKLRKLEELKRIEQGIKS